MIEDAGSALAILEEEEGLLASERLADAREEIERWQARGMQPVTLLDPVYPANLRAVHDRPPLIFVSGQLQPGDGRSVAVVGTRLARPRRRESRGQSPSTWWITAIPSCPDWRAELTPLCTPPPWRTEGARLR